MSLSEIFAELKAAFDKPSPVESSCQSGFKKFQLFLIRNHANLKGAEDLKLAMLGLEMGAQIQVKSSNWAGFERIMQQLRPYYTQGFLRREPSSRRQYLEGLYLLYLLTESKLVEFHTELELMDPAQDFANEWIKISLAVDEAMIVGNYQTIDRVVDSCKDRDYLALLARLNNAIRDEIARSLEVVHDSMPLMDAVEILRFSSPAELKQYITDKSKDWDIVDDRLRFAAVVESRSDIKAPETIEDLLRFTKSIEAIV